MAQIHKNEFHGAGVLARDPELKYTPSGKAVAKFTIASTHDKYTEYIRCVAWEGLAEKCQTFRKGDFVRVVGRLQTRSWDDKHSGQKKYMTEVVAFQVAAPEDAPEPLTPDPNRKSGTEIARALLRPAAKPNINRVPITDDDVPF